jgi:hypothetical protein
MDRSSLGARGVRVRAKRRPWASEVAESPTCVGRLPAGAGQFNWWKMPTEIPCQDSAANGRRPTCQKGGSTRG